MHEEIASSQPVVGKNLTTLKRHRDEITKNHFDDVVNFTDNEVSNEDCESDLDDDERQLWKVE